MLNLMMEIYLFKMYLHSSFVAKKFNYGNNNCSEIAKVLKEITVFLSASSGAFNGYNLNRLAFIMQNKSQEPLKGKIG